MLQQNHANNSLNLDNKKSQFDLSMLELNRTLKNCIQLMFSIKKKKS